MWSISSSERNLFQALQMLRKLSILHQEDENEKAASSALAYGRRWQMSNPIIKVWEAKDDIDAMTLFKMAKAQLCSSIYLRWPEKTPDWEAKAEKDAAENEETLMSCELPHHFSGQVCA